MSANYKFKKKVDDLFYGVYNYSECKKNKEVCFSVTSGFNAEALFKLSDLLGTGTIHSSPDASETYGCPTCGGDITSWIRISASEVKF